MILQTSDIAECPSEQEDFLAPEAAETPAPVYARLARTPDEITQAQKVRYKVFYEEHGAIPSEDVRNQERDFDKFDDIADHLIVLSRNPDSPEDEEIVGTYRLLRQDVAKARGGFYSANEYDLTNLINSGLPMLELGRSCVLAEYRTKPILNMLWQGIADYVTEHNIGVLFGCASFPGTDPKAIAQWLSYLHYFHPTPANMRVRALPEHYVPMDALPKAEIDERRAFSSLPPLIKGYLRIGGTVGDGAVIDPQFNTVDVFVAVQTIHVTSRYRKYYERKIQKPLPGQNFSAPPLGEE